jgi:regulator of sirC expression with transglutaminase-like and TPR domain
VTRRAVLLALALASCHRGATLEEAAARVRARLARGESAREALNHAVFDDLGFAREVESTDPRFMRLDSVLAARRGSCFGLAALYLALGQRVGREAGFSVAAVLVPGHMFVRVTDAAGTRPAELLRRGEEMPEAWYRGKYAVPPDGAPAYLRPLVPDEVLGVLDFNVGNDLRRRGRLAKAAAAYRVATRRFPQLAEAHASLGLVLHLQGALADAEAAYRAAAAQNPHLPGLEQNLAVLRAERAGTAPAGYR